MPTWPSASRRRAYPPAAEGLAALARATFCGRIVIGRIPRARVRLPRQVRMSGPKHARSAPPRANQRLRGSGTFAARVWRPIEIPICARKIRPPESFCAFLPSGRDREEERERVRASASERTDSCRLPLEYNDERMIYGGPGLHSASCFYFQDRNCPNQHSRGDA